MYCAIDVEATGEGFDRKAIAISFVVGHKKYFKIEKSLTVCFPVPSVEQFGTLCWNEFWMKEENQKVLDRIRKEVRSSDEEASKEIETFLKELEDQYGDNIEFLSDNPSFDITAVDWALYRFTKRLPMRFSTKGKYRCISDPSERIAAFGKWKETNEIISKNYGIEHDHWPENDAAYIYAQMIEANKLSKDYSEMERNYQSLKGSFFVMFLAFILLRLFV